MLYNLYLSNYFCLELNEDLLGSDEKIEFSHPLGQLTIKKAHVSYILNELFLTQDQIDLLKKIDIFNQIHEFKIFVLNGEKWEEKSKIKSSIAEIWQGLKNQNFMI